MAPHERTPGGPPPDKPAWAAWIEDALTAWPAAVPAAGFATAPSVAEIAIPLRPLADIAGRQVMCEANVLNGGAAGGVGEEFVRRLALRLANIAGRTLVTELNQARANGILMGATSRDRFVDFVRRLAERDAIWALLTKYPVLARLLGEACVQAIAAQVELLHRLAGDRAAIVDQLLNGVDPGPLSAIEPGAGDFHQRGRSVSVVRFANGARVVYKPRCQRVQQLFNELLVWLGARLTHQLDLRTVAVLARRSYGWLEFVEHRPCADLDQVDRFYRRLGALLALLYAVEGTDIHYENLIAHGDQPVLVDVETLFHPQVAPVMLAGADPALAALNSSVCRSSLLPQFQLGEHGTLDMSGMGGDPGAALPVEQISWASVGTDRMHLVRVAATLEGAANRPVLDGQLVDPTDYAASISAGFRAGYDAIVGHRHELLGDQGLLRRFAGRTTRLVSRATQIYAILLRESSHPDLLGDGHDRDRIFDLLRQDKAGGSVTKALVRHEVADLWAGNIPLFAVRPDSRDIWTSTGCTVRDGLAEAGLTTATHKLAGLTELDRRRQEWLITATLGVRTRRAGQQHHSGASVSGPLAASTPDPQRLLVEATRIADEIIASAVHGGRRANWIGLELVDGQNWAVQPMGAGLGNGYTGVALFLAQLGRLTGTTRYVELARDALRPLPNLIDAMAAEPELARAVGPGGFLGLAGIGYALSRVASLDGDTGLDSCLAATVDLAARCGEAEQSDLTLGHAGGLAALLAVGRETGNVTASRAAGMFADRLLARRASTATRAGFAMDDAGVAFALARYAVGADVYLASARSVPLPEPDSANHAWCTGLSGTVLVRAELARHRVVEPQDQSDLDRAVAALANDRPPLRDLSLCHGELGILDTLASLASDGHPEAAAALPRRTARMLAVLARSGPRCGTPNGIPSPGLLTGLSGIGYGLLRLGFPRSVPSILTFEPGRRPATEPLARGSWNPAITERNE